MANFVERISQICEQYEKVAIFIDVDGTLVEYPVLTTEEVGEIMQSDDYYTTKKPIPCMMQVVRELTKIPNLDFFILSMSRNTKITESKKDWLSRYFSFIPEENWILLNKETGGYSYSNRNMQKPLEILKKGYVHSILLDDDSAVLKEAKKFEGITPFHISSALV